MTVILLAAINQDYQELFAKIKIDNYAADKLTDKCNFYHFYLKDINNIAANVIKQEALSKGAEAVVSRQTLVNPKGTTDILLAVTGKQLQLFLTSIAEQPFGLKALAQEILTTYENMRHPLPTLQIRGQLVDFSQKTYVMGILNVTPDSFSDGGKFQSPQSALEQAQKLIAEGADIIDIGGESTRPGSKQITVEEELARVIPVITALRKLNSKIILSIDTTKAQVAKAAVQAGADLVNDVSAGLFDQKMLTTVAELGVPIVLMHTPATPDMMQSKTEYDNFLVDIYVALEKRVHAAQEAGINRGNIIIDPGIGFGKNRQQNLALINNIAVFQGLGLPVLIGSSRKRFIGDILAKDANERIFGTAATLAISVYHNVNIVRVHDVAQMVDVVKIAQSIREEDGNA